MACVGQTPALRVPFSRRSSRYGFQNFVYIHTSLREIALSQVCEKTRLLPS